jgi:hypothetical protein
MLMRRRRRRIIFITRFSVTVYMTILNLTFYMPIYAVICGDYVRCWP